MEDMEIKKEGNLNLKEETIEINNIKTEMYSESDIDVENEQPEHSYESNSSVHTELVPNLSCCNVKDEKIPSEDENMNMDQHYSHEVMAKHRTKKRRKNITMKKQPRIKHTYSEETLQKALTDIIQNNVSKREAAKKYHIPRSTILFRLSQKFKKSGHGPAPALTLEEESQLEKWICDCVQKGFPLRKENVQVSVKGFIELNNRENCFIDNMPGDGWFRCFLKRHSEITHRMSEAVTTASACVQEADIKKWFTQIKESLISEGQSLDILEDPSRIFHLDETSFQFCPNDSKVLGVKGTTSVNEVDRSTEKSNLTVLSTFSADGTIVPTCIVYPYQRIPKEIKNAVPKSWGIGKSENGCMKTEVLWEFLVNVFAIFLDDNEIKKPVILYIDGHKSHLSYQISELCSELSIILIALYPNVTRILHPVDVSAFKPLKSAWIKGIRKWMRENHNKSITVKNFAPFLETVIENGLNSDIIKNGFSATGLFPFSSENINYTRCLKRSKSQETDLIVDFETFASIVGEEDIENFKQRQTNELLPGESEDHFKLYKIFTRLVRTDLTNMDNQDSDQIVIETTDSEITDDPIFFDVPQTENRTLIDN